jgi:hypothetical protein
LPGFTAKISQTRERAEKMPNKWLTSVTGNLLAGSSEMLCKLEWWNFSPTRLVEEQTRANQLYEKRRCLRK